MLRSAADCRHRNVRHRRIGRRTMPVALASFDMHDVADCDVTLFSFTRDLSLSRCDNKNLIAVVHMPAGRGADAHAVRGLRAGP